MRVELPANPKHPLYALVRQVIDKAGLLFILGITASNFDYTEWRTLLLMLFVGSGSEGLTNQIVGVLAKRGKESETNRGGQ